MRAPLKLRTIWSTFKIWPLTEEEKAKNMVAARAIRITLGFLPWLVIAVFSYIYIWLGYYNELHLRNGIDLGTYNQLLYNLSSGHQWPPFNSLKNQVAWGDHAHFIMAFFAPLYYLVPSYLTVIALQVLAITSSAWALYWIALKTIKSQIYSYVLLFSYLLFFGVQYALNFDFHPNVLTAAVIAWSLYALHFKIWPLYWGLLILGLTTREDAATFYVMIGVYLILFSPTIPFAKKWTGANWHPVKTVGLVTIVLAAAYFIVVVYYLMPLWQPNSTALAYFDIPDRARTPVAIIHWIIGNPLTVAQDIFDTPTKVRTITSLFQAWGWLPLLSPFTYLAVAPNFLARFLSQEELRHMMQLHYGASLVSILAYGSILATRNLLRLSQRLSRAKIKQEATWLSFSLTAACAALLGWGTYTTSLRDVDLPIQRVFNQEFIELRAQPRPARAALEVVRRLIPAEASVAAASGLVPALSAREQIYYFSEELNSTVDWIVLSDEGNTWPLTTGEMSAAIKSLRSHADYTLVFDNYGIVAWRQKTK